MRQLLLVTALGSAMGFSAIVASQYTDSRQYSTGDFNDCAQIGEGGDPWQNALKNRDKVPANLQPVTLTIQQILDDKPALALAAGKRYRQNWSHDARAQIADQENTLVTVEGCVLAAKDQAPEDCNCKSPTAVDTHVWLGAHAGDPLSNSVVVEVSPRMKVQHPNWNGRSLSSNVSLTHYRITGWRMWDEEHKSNIGKTRGTLWEIHPITRIEIQGSDGSWHDLQ